MYCNKCGKQITDNSVFCNFCGEKIEIIENEENNKKVNEKPLADSIEQNINSETIQDDLTTEPPENNNIQPTFIPQNDNSNKTYKIPNAKTEQEITPKIKAVAIVLAVFFSYWTWLYTYKRNKVKFWVALGVSMIIGIECISLSIAYGVRLNLNSNFDIRYMALYYVVYFGMWLWSLIYTCRKPKNFYINYPKG